MSHWVAAETADSQLADVRHTTRLAQLLTRLSAQPVRSIPSACHGWAETVAASRFLENPAIGEQELLSGHKHATLERIRTQEVVRLVQDTTCLNYGTTQPKHGMGTVRVKTRKEYLLHTTVAFTPDRVNLGVLGMKVWQRPEQPVAQERKRKPIEEQESYRGLEGSQLACAVKQTCPAPLVVHVADREGDIQEWFLHARRREPEQRAEYIVRAQGNRRLAPGSAQRHWWAEMRQTRALGEMTVELARQPARPPRQVTRSVTAKLVTCNGARRARSTLPPVEVTAVYAQECSPPPGEAPLEWLWLTSLPVTDFPRACTVGRWYRCRWEIALFFRVRKPGCQIAPWRVQTAQRVLNAMAISVLVAWRIHTITMVGRAYPEVPGDVVCEPREWHTIDPMPPHRRPPQMSPPLRAMVRSLAPCGGFFARTGDGEPGIQAIWQGYQRLQAFIDAVETYQTVHSL
jgi:hypothetical protein